MANASGTSGFNLDLNTMVEEAFERCGQELRTGYDLRTATRSLNLLTIEWANRGINLWTVERGEIPLLTGVSTYALPDDTIDLADHVVRTGAGSTESDLSITRISLSTYSTIPNKKSTGRPIQIWVNRQSGTTYPDLRRMPIEVTVWPVPDQDDFYTLVYWRLRRINDAGSGVNVPDIPFRFLPALVAGLAFHLSKKLPGGMERMQFLKADYDEAWQNAADEDREKADARFVPRNMRI